MSIDQPKYLIIGAGIGGLALGLALLRSGHSVKILESAPALKEVGAGISLSPNAFHALSYIGLKDFIVSKADMPTKTAVLHYQTGDVLAEVPFGENFEERYGSKYYQIHRADLHEGMLSAVQDLDETCITVDHHVAEVHQTDDGTTAICANGIKFDADFIVGCDGSRSIVRDVVFGAPDLKWTGQVAYRAIIPSDSVADFIATAPTAVTIGPAHTVTRYPIRHGELVNFVAIAQSDAWKAEGWNHPATVEEVRNEHMGWNDDIQGIIHAIPEDHLIKWALFDREPLMSWVNGRIALLGDAAHPMLPFLGMGAAMGLEDAVVLARCIDTYGDTHLALKRYELARMDRANGTLLASRRQGQLLQNSNPDQQNWGKDESLDGEEWIRYSYDPATVQI